MVVNHSVHDFVRDDFRKVQRGKGKQQETGGTVTRNSDPPGIEEITDTLRDSRR